MTRTPGLSVFAILAVMTCFPSSPSAARFLQADPIGYQDQVNLYAYVENDPLNQVDPTGEDAIVLLRENGSVDIVLPMTFSGDAATPGNVAAAIQNIQNTWTGTFGGVSVTTTVVSGTSPLDPSVSNSMAITSGNTSMRDPTNGHQGHSFVASGKAGEVTMKDITGTGIRQPNGAMTVSDKGISTYAHEGGHYLGLRDAGTRSLMGPGSSTEITGNDINTIKHTATPSGAVNTVIRCAEDERCR